MKEGGPAPSLLMVRRVPGDVVQMHLVDIKRRGARCSASRRHANEQVVGWLQNGCAVGARMGYSTPFTYIEVPLADHDTATCDHCAKGSGPALVSTCSPL